METSRLKQIVQTWAQLESLTYIWLKTSHYRFAEVLTYELSLRFLKGKLCLL